MLFRSSTWTAEEQPTKNYVAKPLLSREGSNIDLYVDGQLAESTDGIYYGKKIFQQKAELFQQDGNHAVIGSWIVGNRSAGIIVRDTPHMIVQDRSRVVPHWFT